LRGACENLLVTLIQTTNHLLTLSSLSNSFNNSFINECSLISTDSQDSSSHAFTIIGVELLEDSIQHTTSSCILAKFALAQLMDDIDFRILTYPEQQLKQQYPDIRVRQATASTFAKFIKSQQTKKCFESSTNDSKNEKDSSTTSNTDKVKKVNHTQLGTFGNYSN
ncbi:unnamed protein product, partial [Rotaria sp. Silwood1]